MYYQVCPTPFDNEAIVEQQMESIKNVLKPLDEVERAAMELISACRE